MEYVTENRLIKRIVKGIDVNSSDSNLADGCRAAMILAHNYENGKGWYWDAVLRGEEEQWVIEHE